MNVWEELESLSKDELIIELARSKYRFNLLMSINGITEDTIRGRFDKDLMQVPSEEWASKIMLYAGRNRPCDEEMDSCIAYDYGMDDDAADELFERMCESGAFEYPSYDPRSRNHGKSDRTGTEGSE